MLPVSGSCMNDALFYFLCSSLSFKLKKKNALREDGLVQSTRMYFIFCPFSQSPGFVQGINIKYIYIYIL